MTNVAFIMDGNRRWAKENDMENLEGHMEGCIKLNTVLEFFIENFEKLNVNSITFFALSIDNIINRNKNEIESLYKIINDYFENLQLDFESFKDRIKIKFLGDFSVLPYEISSHLRKIENEFFSLSNDNQKLLIQFCVGYDGRNEIINAVNTLFSSKFTYSMITKEEFEKYLYTSISPDIVIRTGKEFRQSGFLTWQTVYSEWFYLDVYWPDIEIETIEDIIINQYPKRKRRFGGN